MNKKGFTLFEVIVSIVLISIVLISMMATLVKIKESYEIVYENSDALIYSSSIARIMNNDFEKNGGIRFVDCNYDGNECDITLNNDQKRKIEIYNVYLGTEITESMGVKYYVPEGSGVRYGGIVKSDVENGGAIFCEKVTLKGVEGYHADCGKQEGEPIRCTCAKEIVATTLKYSDTTDLTNSNNIYLKTLKAEKNAFLEKGLDEVNPDRYVFSGKSTSTGFNFGKISFTNMVYDSSTRVTPNNKPYKNSISTIAIQINDGVDTENPTYNINLSSTSIFDPDRVQTGSTLCFPLNDAAPAGTTVTKKAKSLCAKYGVGFFIEDMDNKQNKIEGNTIPDQYKPTISGGGKTFNGYYYTYGGKTIQIVDENMKIKISTNYFDSTKQPSEEDPNVEETIVFKAQWN